MSDKLLCRSAGHVEAEADTIVVLAELADLLDGFVPAEGRKDLKEVEELLRLVYTAEPTRCVILKLSNVLLYLFYE